MLKNKVEACHDGEEIISHACKLKKLKGRLVLI